MMFRSVVAMLALGLFAGSADAARGDNAIQLDVVQPVSVQLDRVKQALTHSDYSELTAVQRESVRAALESIERLMAGRESSSQLNPAEQVVLFNHQEEVNTVMLRAHEDSRMVCRREKSVGSNMPTNVCMTVAQRRTSRNDAERIFRDRAPPIGKPNL